MDAGTAAAAPSVVSLFMPPGEEEDIRASVGKMRTSYRVTHQVVPNLMLT